MCFLSRALCAAFTFFSVRKSPQSFSGKLANWFRPRWIMCQWNHSQLPQMDHVASALFFHFSCSYLHSGTYHLLCCLSPASSPHHPITAHRIVISSLKAANYISCSYFYYYHQGEGHTILSIQRSLMKKYEWTVHMLFFTNGSPNPFPSRYFLS